MKRGPAYRDSADLNRLQMRDRRKSAGAPHLHDYIFNNSGRLDRREFKSRGSPRRLADNPEFLKKSVIIYLYNNAINTEWQILARLGDFFTKAERVFRVGKCRGFMV